MSRPSLVDGLLYVALVVLLGVALVLGYGLYSRLGTPRTLPLDPVAEAGEGERRIEVAVRNGAGVTGLARETTLHLRRRGFDVLETGNLRDGRDSSVVVVRDSSDAERARRVAAALGLPAHRIEVRPLRPSDPQVAVELGRDYARLSPFAARETPAP
ncbi:MAG: LytR C-terminal domain-containing protein [Rubricoccaceae bacterium]